MDFEAAVARGRELLARSNHDQWELAKLAYDVWHDGIRGDLARWSERLGVSSSHASQLKATWERYHELYPDRLTRSFNEYYTLASVSKARAAKLARTADGEGRGVGAVHRRGRDRDELETTRALLRSRNGVRRALDDPKVRASVERELRARAAREAPGPAEGLTGRRQQEQLARELADVQHRLSTVLGRMADLQLNRDIRARVLKTFRQLSNSLGWLRTFLRSEDRPMDEALDRILEEGGSSPGGRGRGRRRTPEKDVGGRVRTGDGTVRDGPRRSRAS